jgi:hypothetical protein
MAKKGIINNSDFSELVPMGLSSSESEFIVGKEALDGVNPLSGNVPS